MKRLSTLALGFILCAVWAPAALAQAGMSEALVLVGRITFIDGQLLRYVYDEKDWVATVKDAPFGLDDAVYSGDTGKAEFKLPNGIWVRTGSDTQIQLLALRDDVTEIDVASGTVRFYNKSQKAVIKATTPYGYVMAKPGCAFDLYVGDESAEVTSLDGAVDFVTGEKESRYVVEAGGKSIISDGKLAAEGDGQVDADWDEWNLRREELWTQRVQVKGESVDYLPPELRDDAVELDRNGKWEQVYYDGGYKNMWHPTDVSAGWQPFTDGRWTVWHSDNVWIPGESFGYVTHHYGNWVRLNSGWYWVPPAASGTRYVSWYPGRVSWIHSDSQVGWVPLAPGETYYSYHYWGPAGVVTGTRQTTVSIGVDRLAYAGYAVVVPRGSLYTVNSYSGVRVAGINRTAIVSSYRAAPVVNNSVVPNYGSMRSRYVYNTNFAMLSVKPHRTVVTRINRNRAVALRVRSGISGSAVQRNTARIGRGQLASGSLAARQVGGLRVTGWMVPENMVNRPRSEVRFNQRSLKTQKKMPQRWPGLQGSGSRPFSVQTTQALHGNGAGRLGRAGASNGVRYGTHTRKMSTRHMTRGTLRTHTGGHRGAVHGQSRTHQERRLKTLH